MVIQDSKSITQPVHRIQCQNEILSLDKPNAPLLQQQQHYRHGGMQVRKDYLSGRAVWPKDATVEEEAGTVAVNMRWRWMGGSSEARPALPDKLLKVNKVDVPGG